MCDTTYHGAAREQQLVRHVFDEEDMFVALSCLLEALF
jgi:hypothetical protein